MPEYRDLCDGVGPRSLTDFDDWVPLRRLERLRALLPGERVGPPPRLLLFSRSGFAAGVTEEAAARPDVELVDLERIYRGS